MGRDRISGPAFGAARPSTCSGLATRGSAGRQGPALAFETAVELHDEEFPLDGRKAAVDERLQVGVALKRRPVADVHGFLAEPNVSGRKHQIVRHDPERPEDPAVDDVLVMRQLVLHPPYVVHEIH